MANDYREPALKPASALTREVNEELSDISAVRETTAELAQVASEIDEPLTPEQQGRFLGGLKSRFDPLPQLHEGISWTDVEKSLKADPEAMRKLNALDVKGHDMYVFGEENGEFIFVSGWNDYREVSEDHRNIVFDKEAQDYLAKHFPNVSCNGNAEDIATALGVALADPEFHEKLRKAIDVNGWAWLKTDAATRKSGFVFVGDHYGFAGRYANFPDEDRSFRAALRVKKA